MLFFPTRSDQYKTGPFEVVTTNIITTKIGNNKNNTDTNKTIKSNILFIRDLKFQECIYDNKNLLKTSFSLKRTNFNHYIYLSCISSHTIGESRKNNNLFIWSVV